MRGKALKSKLEELVDGIQQRIDFVTATGVSSFEQETEQNYGKLEYLQSKIKKDDGISDWVDEKQRLSGRLNKLEKQVQELEELADEWENYLQLLADTKLRKDNV
ncbi:uncharacterized protein KLLA0_E07679g [Kluyveromyces lactis]|uniref:Biogenesis of lysosome-related organelles complex 1 subunit BLI1 n=1 Tax=Kluyveromyces lactis (strain ATCC 8585 / CBS 2359 / DSM 70799 / NBRC 1267 / NRRL Y-1140 / WM37) TaxID=284590 RepID=BLI1_KLULA|nr:uncharacterized protein KLLA0_E07679g [Kluyveromyces lactis]Q6CP44.1 RecName: Full=Biogenesis of lysosome-related organelles complex 1 subunit BLI1; Short=BLOC-1 subunit BLI1; AltName: Full=BLOC-1 interactor 1 [Kluyveromyces lactis NRRL Y-1140]CAG99382.1 KLLA0E07679p [Kluyveromyces lactis]|eukprot:XP_454295.1 uncharacterized protein KLLA0_E07679g [Kluyveromyces lactis]